MELSGQNQAFNNYLSQAKDAQNAGDYKMASKLYLQAAEAAYQISQATTNNKVKSQYREVAQNLLDVKKTLDSKINAKPNKAESGNKKEEDSTIRVQQNEKVSKEEALGKLNSLIGLASVKHEVDAWIKQIEGKAIRQKFNLKGSKTSYHMIFTGNPGTGKTTVARIMGQIFCAMGIVSKGQLVEVGRNNLVAGYVGQTAIKTSEVIEKAKGGVLFIDEAYTLSQGGDNDFGQEAIATVLKAMEDYRDDLVVIVAGYEDLMQNFIDSNPGLASRFNHTFNFEDYNSGELYDIFTKLCKDNDYVLEDGLSVDIIEYFNNICLNKDKNFGNARDVRNIFEKIEEVQNARLTANMSKEEIMLIKRCDFEKAIQ